MSKSKTPKLSPSTRKELAALRPALDSAREIYRQPPIQCSAELEAIAGRRDPAWGEAWERTPELVRARFLWLEDQHNELLREVAELRRLQERIAQELDAQDARDNKGGRPPLALDDEIEQAEAELHKRHPKGYPYTGSEPRAMEYARAVAGIINTWHPDGEPIAPETVAKRLRQIHKKEQRATPKGAAKPRVSGDAD